VMKTIQIQYHCLVQNEGATATRSKWLSDLLSLGWVWLCAELLSLRERVRGLSSEVQRRASEAHEARRNEKGLAVRRSLFVPPRSQWAAVADVGWP
jgi:hypothetical protein